MKFTALIPVLFLVACQMPDAGSAPEDACGASAYQNLVGAPAAAAPSVREVVASSDAESVC